MESKTSSQAQLTIVVFVHNMAKHLSRCLHSLCRQTLKDIKIICVNDGSTDSGLRILRDFAQKDSRISIINQKRKGSGCAKNRALKLVKTPYVTFINGNDRLETGAYKKCLGFFADNIDVVCFGSKKISALPSEQDVNNNAGLSGKKETDTNIIEQVDKHLGSKLFRISVIREYNLKFERLPYYEDICFYHCYMAATKNIYVIPDIYYNYRLDGEKHNPSDLLKTSLPIYKFYVRYDIFRYFHHFYLSLLKNFYNYAHGKQPREADKLIEQFIRRFNLQQVFPKDAFIMSHYRSPVGRNCSKILYCFRKHPIFVKETTPLKTAYYLWGLPLWSIGNTPSRRTFRYSFMKFPLFKHSCKQYFTPKNPALPEPIKQDYKVKVSVVVPVYNTAEFLAQCLESLCRQTLKDIEIICINDGSTDSSLRILKDFARKDRRIKIINQENQGLSCSRNAGIMRASGEYIGFVDSDDMVADNFYECLYKRAVATSADIAAANIIRVNNNGQSMFLDYKKNETVELIQDKFRVLRIPDFNYVWNRIYAAGLFTDKDAYFPEHLYYEDIIWTPKMLLKSRKISTITQTCYYYRQNANSIMSTSRFSAIKTRHAHNHLRWEDDFIEKYRINEQTETYKLFNSLYLYKIAKGKDYEKHYLFGFIPLKFKRNRRNVQEFGWFGIPLVKISSAADCASQEYRILGIKFIKRQIK